LLIVVFIFLDYNVSSYEARLSFNLPSNDIERIFTENQNPCKFFLETSAKIFRRLINREVEKKLKYLIVFIARYENRMNTG